jgi:predicted nucleic acid-binding protein
VNRRTIYVDTTPLYGVLTPGDQHELRARELFSSLDHASVFVPLTTLLELYSLILYRKPRAPGYAHRAVSKITAAYPTAYPLEADKTAALALLGRYPDQAITLSDAVTACMAKRENAQVMTFDYRHFDLLGAEVYRP